MGDPKATLADAADVAFLFVATELPSQIASSQIASWHNAMSNTPRITTDQYDRLTMIQSGTLVGTEKKTEPVHGELRELDPAGPT